MRPADGMRAARSACGDEWRVVGKGGEQSDFFTEGNEVNEGGGK